MISNSSKLSKKSNTSVRSKKKALYTGIMNEYKPRRNLGGSGVAGVVKRRSKSRDRGLGNRSKSRDSERNRSFSKGKQKVYKLPGTFGGSRNNSRSNSKVKRRKSSSRNSSGRNVNSEIFLIF